MAIQTRNPLQAQAFLSRNPNFRAPRSEALLRQFPAIERIARLNAGHLIRAAQKRPEIFGGSRQVLVATDWGEAGNRIGSYILHYSGHTLSPAVRSLVGVDICNLSHSLPAFDVREAARFWEGNINLLQGNTIAICVVDPGVGSERKPLIAKAQNGCYLIGPDNGCFDLALRGLNAAVGLDGAWAIRYDSPHIVSKGEGRVERVDGNFVFPAAAAAIICNVPFSEFADRLPDSQFGERLDWNDAKIESINGSRNGIGEKGVPVILPPSSGKKAIIGRIDGIDEPYGTYVTNVSPELLERIGAKPNEGALEIVGRKSNAHLYLPFVTHFSAVNFGQPLATFHGNTFLHIAVNRGSAAATLGLQVGEEIEIRAFEFCNKKLEVR